MCYKTPKYNAMRNINKAYTEIEYEDIELLKKSIKKYGKKQVLDKINNSKYFHFMI